MSNITQAFTATGQTIAFLLKPKEILEYSIAGTFVGTAILEKVEGGGFNPIATVSAPATAQLTNDTNLSERYRWRISAYTSGTINTSLIDIPDTIKTFKDFDGADVLEVFEGGYSLVAASLPPTRAGAGRFYTKIVGSIAESFYLDSAGNEIQLTNAGAMLMPSNVVVDGGNTLGAALTIGTNDNFALNFESNAITRVTIANSGAFTHIPAAAFTVQGGDLRSGEASTTDGTLVLLNSTNANTVTIQPGVTTGSYSLTLPVDDGGASEFLQTNGSGVLTWAAPTAGGSIGSTMTGGTVGSIPFIATGPVWAQDNTNLFWDNASKFFGLGTATPSSLAHLLDGGLTVEADASAFNAATMTAYNSTTAADGNIILLQRTRNASPTSHTLVVNGDVLGRIRARGSDGVGYESAAEIRFEVDGVAASDDMPGRIVFATTAGGATSSTEHMRIDSGGNVGIGTTNIGSQVEIARDGAASSLRATAYSTTATHGGGLTLRKARGTEAAPTNVGNGDTIGTIAFLMHDGAAFQGGATIKCFADGGVSAGDTPGRLEFATTADGAASLTNRMTIKSNGVVNIIGELDLGGVFNHDGTTFGALGVAPASQRALVASLTDSTGGTANDTLVAISGSGDDAEINNNFADGAAKINELYTLVKQFGFMASV